MSHFPPPPNPDPTPYRTSTLPYATPIASAPQRPTSVLVLGIIGIVFGAMGVLCTPFSLLGAITGSTVSTVSTSTTAGATTSYSSSSTSVTGLGSEFTVYTLINGGITILLSILLLAAAIGAIRLSRWARKGLMAYAWLTIVTATISLVFTILFLGPAMQQQFQSQGMTGIPPSALQAMVVGFSVLGYLVGLIYPICVLVFFRRPNVVQAFDTGMSHAA